MRAGSSGRPSGQTGDWRGEKKTHDGNACDSRSLWSGNRAPHSRSSANPWRLGARIHWRLSFLPNERKHATAIDGATVRQCRLAQRQDSRTRTLLVHWLGLTHRPPMKPIGQTAPIQFGPKRALNHICKLSEWVHSVRGTSAAMTRKPCVYKRCPPIIATGISHS